MRKMKIDGLSGLRVSDYQFPIDVSGVAKDHPFLEADSLQSLFRRLHALNRCANMKLDTHHTHHSTSHGKSVSTRRITRIRRSTYEKRCASGRAHGDATRHSNERSVNLIGINPNFIDFRILRNSRSNQICRNNFDSATFAIPTLFFCPTP